MMSCRVLPFLALLAACNSAGGARAPGVGTVPTPGGTGEPGALTISPDAIGTIVGSTVTFTVTPTTSITWTVAEGAGCGDITAAGVYTAPPSPTTCTVTATATSDATLQAQASIVVYANTVGTWVNITPPPYWALMQANNVYPTSHDYSMTGVGLSPAAPATIYASTYGGHGLFKSTDRGNTWAGPIGATFLNVDGTTHTQGNPWTTGGATSWTIAVDPLDANTVYVHSSFGGDPGPWKSTDGGDTWRQLFSRSDGQEMTPDVYAIAVDPNDHQHLLITFHSPWKLTQNAGILESVDGGTTFIKHYPVAMGGAVPDSGAGHYAFFLGRKNDGTVDASGKFWIFATQGNGFWRTEDGGTTWTEVASGYNMQHGAGGLYRASTGVLYMGAVRHLLRSTDNGRTWTLAGEPPTGSGLDDFLHDGYNAVIGDGVTMFVMPANTGYHTNGAPTPYYYSSETDGTHWTQYGNQTFYDGPGWMAADAVNHVIYSSNWAAGLWRLETGH